MKKQLRNGLLALGIAVFSAFSSNAQCSGNKVLVGHWTLCGRVSCIEYKCIPPSLVQKYLQKGWFISTLSAVKKGNTNPDKNTQKSTGNISLWATNKLNSTPKKKAR